jgi:hypothetical protein
MIVGRLDCVQPHPGCLATSSQLEIGHVNRKMARGVVCGLLLAGVVSLATWAASWPVPAVALARPSASSLDPPVRALDAGKLVPGLREVAAVTRQSQPTAPDGIWRPALVTSWQWQLTMPVDQSVDVVMYDIDLFTNSADVVAALRARGRKVICYMSAGTYENWRPDADRFPRDVLGGGLNWRGENWLDVRRLDVLGPIMEARLDLCRAKGFDGVEPDNVDGYANRTGFPLGPDDQLRYNVFLANAAHARGLSVGLKNDVRQVEELLPYFDWALSEQCFEYRVCRTLLPFIAAGKAVFEVEYELDAEEFCPQANAMNFNAMVKDYRLDEDREPCR